MTLTLYPSIQKQASQNFKIFTDVERAYPLITCPITAQIINPELFISIALDYTAITIDGQYATLADAREYNIDVRVKSQVFTSIQADYRFKVVLSACYASQFQFSSTIPDINYDATIGTITTTIFQTTQANEDCGYLVTYSLTIAQNLVSIPQPGWLSLDVTQRTVSISPTQKQDVGVYQVKIQAQIPQGDPILSTASVIHFTFKINIIDECLTTAFINRSYDLMIAKISQSAIQQDLAVDDEVSNRHSDVGYCEQKIYSMSPTFSFLSFIGSGSTLSVETQDVAHAGQYEITITVALANYPGVANFIQTLRVQIQCEVIQITTNQAPQDITFRLHQDSTIVTFYSFQEFPQCGLIYQLAPNDKNFVSFESQMKKISVFSENDQDEGSYQYILSLTPQNFGLQYSVPFKVIVTNPCKSTQIKSSTLIPNIVNLVPAKPFYEIPISFYHTAQNTTNCGEIEAKVRDSQTKQTPSWSKLQGQKLQFDLQTQIQEIKSHLEIIAKLSRYPDIKYEQPFNVTLNTLNIQCSPQTSNHQVGMSDLSVPVFYSILTEYQDKLTPIFSATSFNFQGNQIEDLPAFIKFIENSQTFNIKTNSPLDEGEYTVGLTIEFKELKDFKTTCSTKIRVNYNPIEDQTLDCHQRWVFKIPEYTDSTGSKLTVKIDFQESQAFLKIENEFIIYEPTYIVPAAYQIKYQVFQEGYSRAYQFTVKVICSDIFIPKKEQYKPPVRPIIFAKNAPKPYIESINNTGLVKIGFTQKLLIPNFDLYPEFQRAEYMRETNFTGVWNHTLPEAARQLATANQKKIEAEAIEIINRGILFINNTQQPIVQLSLKPNQLVNPEQKSFSYKCVSFKEIYMEFQANFTQFDQISIQDYDVMMVQFNGPQYFRTVEDTAFTDSVIVEVNKKVPQQMDAGLANQLQKAASAVKNSSKAAIIFNFALNMVLSGALQQMLAAMKKMQFIIHTLLINVEIPPSCQIFFSSLLKLVTFELIDISSYIRKGLSLEGDTGLQQNFEELGYQSKYSIILLGNLYIALVLNAIGLLLYFSTKRLKSVQWIKKLRQKIKNLLIWNGTLGLINESYLIICISCFVNILSVKQVSKFGEIFSLANTFLLFAVVFGYPILILIVLVKNQRNLRLFKYRQRLGDFYLQFRYQDGKSAVLDPFFSALRRLILAAVAVLLASYPSIQFIVIFLTWNVYCILNGWFLQYKLKSEFYTDLVNEFFIVIFLYNLSLFSDYVADQRGKNLMGFILIGVMLLNMLFNFTLIISQCLSHFIRQLRTKYIQWKHARLIKKLKAIIAIRELQQEKEVKDCAISQTEQEKINFTIKSRDVDWYRNITQNQHLIIQDISKDLQVQVNDELIDYNRSKEGLITIKQRKKIPNEEKNYSYQNNKQIQLQTINEMNEAVEESPWSIDEITRGFQGLESYTAQSQLRPITKKHALGSKAELLRIEEEDYEADQQYRALVQKNGNRRPTFDMVAQQQAQERQNNYPQIEEEDYEADQQYRALVQKNGNRRPTYDMVAQQQVQERQKNQQQINFSDFGDEWGQNYNRKQQSQHEKNVRDFYTQNNMAYKLQKEDFITPQQSKSAKLDRIEQHNQLNLIKNSPFTEMENNQKAFDSNQFSDPVNLHRASLMKQIEMNQARKKNISQFNSYRQGQSAERKYEDKNLNNFYIESGVPIYDQKEYTQSYRQTGDLSDPFEHSQRVKIRQASHRNLFVNSQESQRMFNQLWSFDNTQLK